MERSRSNLTVLDEIRLRLAETEQYAEHRDKKTFEDWRVVTVFSGTWVNFDQPTVEERAAYWKDSAGIVRLRGLIKNGTIATSAFTLPVGFRPKGIRRFAVVAAGAFGGLYVDAAGLVVPYIGGTSHISLDGVAFRSEV